ncbi:MAG: DUF222 domain-containing protein, partial [Microbacteriaceae bacterium]|nr:DUF222 domain-containing protein [Microbacteriaceae bacterium]
GQTAAVSIATVHRQACQAGYLPIVFNEHRQVLNLGRTQRLFTPAQRTAITARDGGCLIPGCTRPPSWCEVHHIDHWSRGGRTDIADGVLLCHHHHMWLHDTGRHIQRREDEYWLISPGDAPPVQLESKHPLARDHGEPPRAAPRLGR